MLAPETMGTASKNLIGSKVFINSMLSYLEIFLIAYLF